MQAPPYRAEPPPAGKRVPPPRIVYDLPPPASSSSASSSSPSSSSPSSSSSSSSSSSAPTLLPVRLDAADGHLDLQVDAATGLTASCMHTNGCQYTWKGIRTTYGVRGTGQFYFETKVTHAAEVVMPETPAHTRNVCRVGVSLPLTSLFLGESSDSWGYGGTAKKSFSRKFENYGEPYGVGDVIGTIIDLDNLKLSFTKNGKFLGAAYSLPARVRDSGLFPHFCLKNVDIEVNFSAASAWFAPPNSKIQFLGDVPEKDLLANMVEHPQSPKDCEFIMMVGLPGCGKTFWAEQHSRANPRKSFVVLGTNAVIDQMRVMGVRRQSNYAERWEELMSTATSVFNALIDRASSAGVPRNVIIDQTNVFKNARRRKVHFFREWGVRRAVTIVTDEPTLQQRTAKREREEGKFVPVSAVMDMKAAFSLPAYDDGFTQIEYPEMPEQDSRHEVRRMNDEGRRFKRENPHASGNQPKPHMESRQAAEFACEKDFRNAKRPRDFPEARGDGYPGHNQTRHQGSGGAWNDGRESWGGGPQFPPAWGDRSQGGHGERRVEYAPGGFPGGGKRARHEYDQSYPRRDWEGHPAYRQGESWRGPNAPYASYGNEFQRGPGCEWQANAQDRAWGPRERAPQNFPNAYGGYGFGGRGRGSGPGYMGGGPPRY
ncbi:putative SPRY domain-containing protein [Neospora caninum Liverpool]|uniref:Putative SPRY domain-containing protein n=1 Tax=Neospora caninum (strain Liverpool) TaxID=572307 RepID=F0VC48_NEOCL|nr:putative SPRY domain-containing protein [Neospora caninum Liverpool]CBZ51182.1 putative SPRY domain-containing protein [Neospora caninum Liverpool]CEL68493.1 TPA: SPRY domain-containing protein, putative [Neospora caninum Liverpool]|eukprot:XP_003881215.1 putative SPRY domain-containing protein [Neospora caninum Liverpool]